MAAASSWSSLANETIICEGTVLLGFAPPRRAQWGYNQHLQEVKLSFVRKKGGVFSAPTSLLRLRCLLPSLGIGRVLPFYTYD